MSNIRKTLCCILYIYIFLMPLSSLLHVYSKKWPCRPVEFIDRGLLKSIYVSLSVLIVQIHVSGVTFG